MVKKSYKISKNFRKVSKKKKWRVNLKSKHKNFFLLMAKFLKNYLLKDTEGKLIITSIRTGLFSNIHVYLFVFS